MEICRPRPVLTSQAAKDRLTSRSFRLNFVHALPWGIEMLTVAGVVGLLFVMNASESNPIEREARVEEAFNNLNAENTDELDDFYADSVVFEDPLVKIDGLDTLKKYYADLYESVEEITFVFQKHISQGDSHVAMWTMHLKTKRLNKGKEIVVHGSSVMEFDADDKVVYHRDYFDLGEMIYRQIPVLRFFVRAVDRRLTSDIEQDRVESTKHPDESVEQR